MVTKELNEELDGEYQELQGLLNFKRNSKATPLDEQLKEKHEREAKMSEREKDRKKAKDANKQPTFEELRSELVNQVKNFPLR